MSTSIIDIQRDIFLRTLRSVGQPNEWKALVCDVASKELLDNVVKEDDVLNCNIVEILRLEDSRPTLSDTPAIYLLTPLPHIIEALKADVSRKRYTHSYLICTSQLRRDLHDRLPQLGTREHPQGRPITLGIDYSPQESHLITFREPDSFQILFNASCNELIRPHLERLTQRIVSICASLGEYPIVRYYRPPNARHEAAVLCAHLAKFVQDGLDNFARATPDFPPPSQRPRATLLITDRSMDLMAPIVHELTYQAMVMDLLPIQETNGKLEYINVIRRGHEDEKEVRAQLNEKDKIWVENRHLHMKDLLIKLSEDFKKFQAKNPQFANADNQNISVNTIKDMLAGLPEFQEGKDAFSLHIDMAERCAKAFQTEKLMDVISFEQSLATGLDEDNQRPKNITDQLVQLLAEKPAVPTNNARMLIMYFIYRGGILPKDVEKLLHHGGINDGPYERIIDNLRVLGASPRRTLGDNTNQHQPLYPAKKVVYAQGEEVSLSRFEPMLKYALEEICQGTLDSSKFPPIKPHLDGQAPQANVAQSSLRNTGKPTWASTRPAANKPRQRIIVFVAGGATYSESRVCHEISHQMGKEVFLTTTEMLTPKKFLTECAGLTARREELRLAIDRRPPRLPAWMSEPPPEALRPKQPAPPAQQQQRPSGARLPTEAMQNMNLGPPRPSNGSSRPGSAQTPNTPSSAGSTSAPAEESPGKLKKDKKEKKHLGFFRKH